MSPEEGYTNDKDEEAAQSKEFDPGRVFWCSGMSCCWVRGQPSHELFFALLSFGGTKESNNPFTGD
ncbi:MAG: hypothetical protein U0T81_11890 [Saprospiraceae bacterium]